MKGHTPFCDKYWYKEYQDCWTEIVNNAHINQHRIYWNQHGWRRRLLKKIVWRYYRQWADDEGGFHVYYPDEETFHL